MRFTLAGRKIGFTFAVIENIDNIWVLGNDFRAEYEVSLPSIDCVELPWNKQVHCRCTPVHTRVFLTTQEDKEYPAGHKVVEKVQVNAEAAEGTLYNITPICILNPKQETVRIPAGTVLATAQTMTEKDIAFLNVQEDCRHTAAEPGGKTQAENLGSEFDKYDWEKALGHLTVEEAPKLYSILERYKKLFVEKYRYRGG